MLASPNEMRAYLAAEDSALLRSVLSSYSGQSCLEIGSGNGGALLDLADGFSSVVGTDIVKPGLSDWKQPGVDFVLTDRASCLQDRAFDLVAFNPPYIATESVEDRATDGGRALHVPLAFLGEALRVVRRDGVVLMLLDGETSIGPFESLCDRMGFRLRKIAGRHLFYEELAVYEATSQVTGIDGADPVTLEGHDASMFP